MSTQKLEIALLAVRGLETWRYTNVAALAAMRFVDAPAGAPLDLKPLLRDDRPRIVFINGRFSAELSSAVSDRVQIKALRRADVTPRAEHTGSPFAALNSSGFSDCAQVTVPRDEAQALPIEIVHITDARRGPALAFARTRIALENNAQACIVERYIGIGGDALTPALSEIELADNARLEHIKWVQANNVHIGTCFASVGRDAHLKTTTFGFSAALSRTEMKVELQQGSEVSVDALQLARGNEVRDFATVINHAEPHGKSRQLVKAVVAGHAQSIFAGRIVVKKNAQQTDSGQQSKILLLSKDASAVSKPHLEIHAEDVKCAHGATSGQLADEALFYLRCRGIAEAEAQALLAYGFAHEVVARIDNDAVRDEADKALVRWLADISQ